MHNESALHEAMAQLEPAVDREEGTINGVMFCQRESRNDRIYEDSALEDLSRLYPQAPIRIGHDNSGYLATVGAVGTSEYSRLNSNVSGDISMNRGHAAYEQIMEDAQKRPHLLKLSHEIPSRGYEAEMRDNKLHITRVHKVDCLAIVTDGGVNASLYEEKSKEKPVEIKTAADLQKELPAIYEEVRQAALGEAKNDKKLAETVAERDRLSKELDELKESHSKLQDQVDQEQRKQDLKKEAAKLEVQCSEALLEALKVLEPAEATKILKEQPKLTEENNDGHDDKSGKARQRSGLAGKTNSVKFRRPTEWLSTYAEK